MTTTILASLQAFQLVPHNLQRIPGICGKGFPVGVTGQVCKGVGHLLRRPFRRQGQFLFVLGEVVGFQFNVYFGVVAGAVVGVSGDAAAVRPCAFDHPPAVGGVAEGENAFGVPVDVQAAVFGLAGGFLCGGLWLRSSCVGSSRCGVSVGILRWIWWWRCCC